MKNINEKMETVTAEFKKVSKEVEELLSRRESVLKDPCLDYDAELHEVFNEYEGMAELEETDKPAYNESFSNWLDSVLKDNSLENVLPEYAELVENVGNWGLYKGDLEEALEAMSDALSTIALMIS